MLAAMSTGQSVVGHPLADGTQFHYWLALSHSARSPAAEGAAMRAKPVPRTKDSFLPPGCWRTQAALRWRRRLAGARGGGRVDGLTPFEGGGRRSGYLPRPQARRAGTSRAKGSRRPHVGRTPYPVRARRGGGMYLDEHLPPPAHSPSLQRLLLARPLSPLGLLLHPVFPAQLAKNRPSPAIISPLPRRVCFPINNPCLLWGVKSILGSLPPIPFSSPPRWVFRSFFYYFF